MPNWVHNEVRVYGEEKDVSKFMEKVEENKDNLFESFLPMPQTYRDWDTTNHPNGEGLEVGKENIDILDERKKFVVTEEYIEGLKKATKEQKDKYGVVGWYDWRCRYWGTKWDACDLEYDERSFSFNTAWSAPLPFMKYLAEQYPELGFLLTYADEDTHGGNCGAVIYHNGKVFEELDGSQAFGVTMWNEWDTYYDEVTEEY